MIEGVTYDDRAISGAGHLMSALCQFDELRSVGADQITTEAIVAAINEAGYDEVARLG
jgi:hypothetical protein